MRRAFCILVSICLITLSAVWFLHGSPAPTGYIGPGDIVPVSSSLDGWAGLRAFSQANLTGTTKAAQTCDRATGSICVDKYILPTGYIDTSGLKDAPGQPCYQQECFVAILYDQTRNGHHYHGYDGNPVSRPTFAFNVINGYPALHGDGPHVQGGHDQILQTDITWLHVGNAYTVTSVSYEIGDSGNRITSEGGEGIGYGSSSLNNSANKFTLFYGPLGVNPTLYILGGTHDVSHAITATLNGANSTFYFDGAYTPSCSSSTPGLAGTAYGYAPSIIMGADGSALLGYILEKGIFTNGNTNVPLDPSIIVQLNANQCRAYGGIC